MDRYNSPAVFIDGPAERGTTYNLQPIQYMSCGETGRMYTYYRHKYGYQTRFEGVTYQVWTYVYSISDVAIRPRLSMIRPYLVIHPVNSDNVPLYVRDMLL